MAHYSGRVFIFVQLYPDSTGPRSKKKCLFVCAYVLTPSQSVSCKCLTGRFYEVRTPDKLKAVDPRRLIFVKYPEAT